MSNAGKISSADSRARKTKLEEELISQTVEREMPPLAKLIDALVYISVALGVALLLQLHFLVPVWLFYSVLTGWFVYLLIAIGIATGHKKLYPVVAILAVITLFVSLPQPEHYAYVMAGLSLASITFLLGSASQIALLALLSIYYLARRKWAAASSSV